ncbi:MAG: AMP-binding protein, partial [Bifidobacteriaceae bacterium]|nr:AMP-binding protein [Bifidobacteriaceae bacterium]
MGPDRLLAAVKAALAGGPPFFLPDAVHDVPALPPQAAVAVATSGSTGLARYVALSAAAVRASAAASAAALGGSGNWLLALSPRHIAGLNVAARAALAGAALVGLAPGPFTAEAFAAAAAALPGGPRFTSLVPTQLRRVLAGPPEAIRALAAFTAVLVGGASLDPSLRALAGRAGVRLVETYGMAETCGGCVYDGRPLAGLEIALAGPGVIELSGPMLALGYAEAGRPEPGQPMPALGGAEPGQTAPTGSGFFERQGRRWFASSDLGRWEAAGGGQRRLLVLGRTDNAITTGGHTIAAEAVEAALRELDEVADALVVGLPSAEWGSSVTALAVPADGAGLDLAALRGHVRARLGAAAAPRLAGLVSKLPQVAPGKPDRAAA